MTWPDRPKDSPPNWVWAVLAVLVFAVIICGANGKLPH